MLKGGVFGFGGVGQGMTRTINNSKEWNSDFSIAAVCNRGKAKRDLAEQKYGLKAYETVDGLIDQGIDFMLIVSTSHAHRDAALKCAEAGIPYLIEKPIALTVEHGREIVESAEKAGLITGVNYSMRYNPLYMKMKQMTDSGEIGDLLALWAAVGRGYGLYTNGRLHRAVAEPEESGGWIVHHMCHIVDFACWIGGEIEQVYAAVQSTAPAELESEEIIFATLNFKSGAIGSLRDQSGILREHRAGLAGTNGALMEHWTATSSRNVKPLLVFSRESDPQYHAPHIIDPSESFKPEGGLQHFLTCLKKRKQTDVPVRDALYSLRVCHALRKSAYSGTPAAVDDM